MHEDVESLPNLGGCEERDDPDEKNAESEGDDCAYGRGCGGSLRAGVGVHFGTAWSVVAVRDV